ncbi:uncharacterized protein LOC128235831 [Mya arenaria]|uniref:uncharacterized protein LOC128235831 n=1 Tax=Mya arenaria TaxID=6604 RepID=UPI0022E44291|nr:uncharacterized protein LOC128235831 [Mya arenaria]
MDSILFPLKLYFLLVIAVYAQGTRNVAIGKTASQSSNYRKNKWLAPTAIDGIVGNNSWFSGTCFHTTKEYQPWWRVDLQLDYYITSVVIHNRLDCCTNRAGNIKLTIGKSLNSMKQAGYLDGRLTTHTFTLDPPLVGRFLQLQLIGIERYFHLCEVEVIAYPSGTSNVALGKTASQSSNYGNSYWLASTAVDGNVGNNKISSDSCFHTTKEYQPWWMVDLHQDYYITSVVIHNRLDNCDGRARNIKLTIGKRLDSMYQVGYQDGLLTTRTFTVDPPLVGRYVQLQLIGVMEFFHLCEVEVMAFPLDIAQIEFQRISDNQQYTPQSVTEILVDHLSNDTFRIMCTLNNMTNMKTFGFLVMWQGAYSLIGEMHNVEPSITEIYKKPGSYSNGSSWTAVGRFDNETRNGRYSALGVSRPLSSMTCSDAGVYSCDVGYINSSSIMVFHTGTIRKELKVQVTHSKITKRIFDVSNDEDGISSELTNSTPIVHVGQKLRLQCTANTGSFNTSVQIVWMKRSLANGGHLSPFFSDKHIIGEPKAFGICEFEKTDSIIYEVSQEDAERTPKNGLHFQCYVHIKSIGWKTPEKQRQNFRFVVQFPVNTTVISGIIGGVCALVILGAAGILLKRKISNGYCHKADEKSDETSRNPDAPVDTVPSARDSEIYTEIEFPVNRTVISGILGGVCSLVFLGAVGNLLKRKISNGCCPKVDEKSDETSRNPDAPVDTVPSARDSEIYTEIEFPVNRTVKSGILGGVCSLVFLGAVGNLLKRKISNGCCPKADEKSDETSRNPDAPVDTVPSARDLEIYTEIEETSDSQANRTSESSFTVQTTEPSQYEELSARRSKTYTEIGNGMQ